MRRPAAPLLTVDAGNTRLAFGLADARGVRRTWHWPTPARGRRLDRRALLAGRPAAFRRRRWSGAALASVVPRLDRDLRALLRDWVHAPVLQVRSDQALAVANGYRPPRAAGADRLVNAVAAVAEFGAPVIVVDCGTAVTVDAVDRRRVYCGGAILPGFDLAAAALARNTALLPRLRRWTGPVTALGRTTQASLRAGLILGTAGAVAGLVRRLRERLGSRTPVVATGGRAALLAGRGDWITAFRPRLTHEGLRRVWRDRPEGKGP